MQKFAGLLIILLISLSLTGCVSMRSDVEGLYKEQYAYVKKKPVKVFFDFYHYKKDVGLDVIPKLLYRAAIPDYDDIFKEAFKNLTNISEFETFTNRSDDISDRARLQKRDSAVLRADYTVKVEIQRTKSFITHFLAGMVSTVSATLIPMPYSWDYTINVSVINKERDVAAKYNRQASVTTWYQVLLVPIYPFATEDMKNEEIYIEMLSDIFRQMDHEGVLK